MKEFLEGSLFFGVILCFASYGIGVLLNRRFHSPLSNPMLIGIILSILFLIFSGVSYEHYYQSARYLSYFLTPATVCLAIPLYEKLQILKKNWKAILLGVGMGTFSNLVCILLMCRLFGFGELEYLTLLPKSVTTAIGMDLSAEFGGNVAITTAAIAVTGIAGNFLAIPMCRIFRITEPVARGVAIGTASHAMGTTKAMELGQVEGAISSLSIVVAGILTVIVIPVFASLY